MTEQTFIKTLISHHPGMDLRTLQKKGAPTLPRHRISMALFKLIAKGEVKRTWSMPNPQAHPRAAFRYATYFTCGPWSVAGADPCVCPTRKPKPAYMLSMKDFFPHQKYAPFLYEGKTMNELRDMDEPDEKELEMMNDE